MKKRHIVKIGFYYFATDSMTAATQLITLLSKLEPCEYDYRDDLGGKCFFPKTEPDFEIGLQSNQRWQAPEKPKPSKPMALPAPKRGSILCICEKSYVAPRQSCPHCGRAFAESHSRTHDGTAKDSGLRLI